MDLRDGLTMRVLTPEDAGLLVEATGAETAAVLWGPRPAGPYALADASAVLAEWDRAGGGPFSVGVLRAGRLLGAVGLMPDRPGSVEVAYWVRPEERGRGIASGAVRAVTPWAHDVLAAPRLWLEINPDNEPSLRLARSVGYRYAERLPRHCREWTSADPDRDTWHDCLIWVHLADQTG